MGRPDKEAHRLYMQQWRRRESNHWSRAEIRRVCGLSLQPGNSSMLWAQKGKYFPYFTSSDEDGRESWGASEKFGKEKLLPEGPDITNVRETMRSALRKIRKAQND